MAEGKREFKERLQSEGRWDEFVIARQMYQDHHGVSLSEAGSEIYPFFKPGSKSEDLEGQKWMDVKSLPPDRFQKKKTELDAAERQLREAQAAEDDDEFDGWSRADLPMDIIWVYQNMKVTGVKPEDAPSSGAWALLEWARKPANMRDFYKDFLSRMLPTRAEVDREWQHADDGKSVEETCNQLLELADELGSGADSEGTILLDGAQSTPPQPEVAQAAHS